MLNNVVIIGRLTADPTLRYTGTGTPVAGFSIACGRDFGAKQTDFFDVVAWKGTGEFVSKYFSKGDMIALIGSLQTRDWEDKNGNKRHTVEINATNVYFCGAKRESSSDAPAFAGGFQELDDDEGLPF